jgi:hypothetical protein
MRVSWTGALVLALAVGLVAGLLISVQRPAPAQAREGEAAGGPRYSVVETQGHNLIVTDNKTNTLYFYTIDRDEKIGSELKLRGTLDLTQVGQPGLKPKTTKPEK